MTGNPYSEYDYTLNENGTLVQLRATRPKDYGTTVYTNKAQGLHDQARRRPASRSSPTSRCTRRTHPATPAPQDVNLFPGATAPRTPTYNEADVSDKPAWVQAKPLLDAATAGEDRTRCTASASSRCRPSTASIGQLITTLKQNGQLANTYIVFTSDNGFHLGQHRLPPGKQTAYDEDIHVPLIVRGPGRAEGRDARRTSSATSTRADVRRARPARRTPSFVDGRSFAPLLDANPPAVELVAERVPRRALGADRGRGGRAPDPGTARR